MSWVILGSKGQLGIALQRTFRENGIDFIALDKSTVDITSREKVALLSNYKPSVIVNCAAWTDVDGAEKNMDLANLVNGEGPKNLALFSREFGAKLIHISTDYVFSGHGSKPWSLGDQKNPINVYGASKLQGENAILKINPANSYIIRTAWMYSPWRKNFVKTITKRALLGVESIVVNDQIGQPTSAIDLSILILSFLRKLPRPGIYHGTNSGSATWYEFAREIYNLCNAKMKLVLPAGSEELNVSALRPKYSILDHSMWEGSGIAPMQEWKMALARDFPEILIEVERELQDEQI